MNSTCSFVREDFLKRCYKRDTLGDGTFGSVGLYDTPDGRLVIKESKISNKSLGYPPDFLAEVDMMIKLQAVPSIVTIKGVCFGDDERKGYILMEALDYNLSEWSRQTPFTVRMSYIKDIILMIGGALGIMHHFSYLHNDMKTNNILVQETRSGFKFKLADFGKSIYVSNINNGYGGILKYQPSIELDVYTSEYWAFMVCLVEVIIGGHRMVKCHDLPSEYKYLKPKDREIKEFIHFYNKYKINGCFDLKRYLREALTTSEYEMVPNDFWVFVDPLINPAPKVLPSIASGLDQIGVNLSITVINQVDRALSKSVQTHPKLGIILSEYKQQFKEVKMSRYFDRFIKLMNKFLTYAPGANRLQDIDLKYYGEVAYIIVVRSKAEEFRYFKDVDTFLHWEKVFLAVIGYQILIN